MHLIWAVLYQFVLVASNITALAIMIDFLSQNRVFD